MKRFAVTGLFANGGQDYGMHGTHDLARKAARSAIGAGAQQAVITFINETHVETIRPDNTTQNTRKEAQ